MCAAASSHFERARPESRTPGAIIWRIRPCSGWAELAFLLRRVRAAPLFGRLVQPGRVGGSRGGDGQGAAPRTPPPARLGGGQKGLLNLGQSRKQITKNIRDPFTAIILCTECVIRMPGSPRLRDPPFGGARRRREEFRRVQALCQGKRLPERCPVSARVKLSGDGAAAVREESGYCQQIDRHTRFGKF